MRPFSVISGRYGTLARLQSRRNPLSRSTDARSAGPMISTRRSAKGRPVTTERYAICAAARWPVDIAPGLFLAVLLSMSLHGLFSMPSAMNYVAPRGVSVVCRLFVMSGIVVLGGLLVVTGSMLEVF